MNLSLTSEGQKRNLRNTKYDDRCLKHGEFKYDLSPKELTALFYSQTVEIAEYCSTFCSCPEMTIGTW
jgi:hypothetical protein